MTTIVVLFILYTITSISLMGNTIIQNENAKTLLDSLENGLISLLKKIKTKQPVEATSALFKIFHVIFLSNLVLLLFYSIIGAHSKTVLIALSFLFIAITFIYGSLCMTTQHKTLLKSIKNILLLISGGMILFYLIDITSHTDIISSFYALLKTRLDLFIKMPDNINLFFKTLTIYLILTLPIILIGFFSWLLSVPGTIIAWLLAILTIYSAKIVIIIFPKKPSISAIFTMWLICHIVLFYKALPK